MSVDLITDVPFRNLINIHRQHNSTLTMLLKQNLTSAHSTSDPMKQTEYVGISNYDSRASSALEQSLSPSRIVYFGSSADLEDNISVKNSFLRRWQNVTFSQNHSDAHLYIFDKWVADVLLAKENITSVKHQLVPYLVMNQRLKQRKNTDNIIAGISIDKIQNSQQNAYRMSSTPHNPHDLIKCFAFIAHQPQQQQQQQVSQQQKKQSSQSQQQQQQQQQQHLFAKRCLSLVSYLEINRNIAEGEIQFASATSATTTGTTSSSSTGTGTSSQTSSGDLHPQERVVVGADCAIGSNVEYVQNTEDKSQTTLKRCNVGNHCKIGKNVKLIESVVMDHVTIGNNCTIKNSVICSNASIGNNISLTNCQVGFSYKVTDRGDYKGELFASEHEEE
jgi:translation initiation factor eIF-2B subunit gamma